MDIGDRRLRDMESYVTQLPPHIVRQIEREQQTRVGLKYDPLPLDEIAKYEFIAGARFMAEKCMELVRSLTWISTGDTFDPQTMEANRALAKFNESLTMGEK